MGFTAFHGCHALSPSPPPFPTMMPATNTLTLTAFSSYNNAYCLFPLTKRHHFPSSLRKVMAAQKPNSGARSVGTKKGSFVFPVDGPSSKGPRIVSNSPASVKLLSRVEQLKLLTKAEKAGLLSAAEKFGLSLSAVEELGLLSKAEELGVLSAATDPGTPNTLLNLSLGLLLLGPLCVYFVPEENAWEVALQVVVALVAVVGGSASFAASNFVSDLQKSA